MNDPSGTMPRSTHNHRRRPPAHKSVSLRHSPPADASSSKGRVDHQPTTLSSPNPASDKANPPSSVSPALSLNKYDSGESSDAGKWFETTNNNAQQSKASLVNNDPPFFLRNSSSSETPPDAAHYAHAHAHPALPYRPTLEHFGTDASGTEDFCSVIDDLTVANRKLKQKLKKYEKLYDAHLQEDKLFEVRFHGLPDHKKKELEDTLCKFASELNDSATTDYPQTSSYAPALEAQNTASSMSRFAESGYASLSGSGQNSSAPSNQDKDRRKLSRSAYSRQQQSIQSYLHDIPLGLLPNSNAPMTEKSKKKLVARRLEQVFAGKRSSPGNHPQPMQQEEVAQSAATADRAEREATGQQRKREGMREARIMPNHGDDDDKDDEIIGQSEVVQGFRPALHIAEHDFAGSGLSPDQRPTRPLDLDPCRAQVPMENMDYIRHLGFTPPNVISGEAPEDGHGWIYLNLLINMAQLHTLNVTPKFVKDALHDYSSRLEISRDGRKIRWKGGHDITRHSSEGSSPDNMTGSGSSSKRLTTGTTGASSERQSDYERARKLAEREKEQNKFTYKPLFHKEDSDEEDDLYGLDSESTGNSFHQLRQTGNSSGFGSSAMQNSSSKPRRDHGPMIFYTKAKFCTDLSGDRLGATLTHPWAYKAMTSHPLGAASDSRSPTHQVSDIAEPRGPLDASPMGVDSTSGSRTASSGEDIGFSPENLRTDSGNDSPEHMDFEASGLGGVQPEDNFSIHVRRAQISTAPSGPIARRRSSLYPKKIRDVLNGQQSPEAKDLSPRASPQRVVKEEIISASRKSLPNSTLPPASFLPFDSTSSGELDSDYDSDASSEADSESEDGPATTLQILNISPVDKYGSEEESDEESDYSDDSDGSVDLLATARQLDPQSVRASEREYDAALADRLAEDIPAGSSAATAGGGSGFNTPAGLVASLSQEENARKEMQSTASDGSSMPPRTKNLKRSRTSEAVGTALKSQKTGQ